jgi:hypothetical protein
VPRPHLLAAFLFVLLSAGICAPVLLEPGVLALGHPNADTWNHVWGYAHVAQAWADGSLTHTDALAGGGSLWFIDTPMAAVLTPVTWLFGPIASYNLSIFINLSLAGYASWGLARHLSDSSTAALFSGVVCALSPYLLSQVHSGISEGVGVGWFALSTWALILWREEGGWRRALLAGLALSAAALSSWYNGLFAVLLAVPALWGLDRRRLAHLPALLLPLVLLAVPTFALFRDTLSAPDALVLRDPTRVWGALVGHNSVDLIAWVWPSAAPDLEARFDEALRIGVYLGWALLLPAALAARQGLAKRWLAAGLGTGLLALGPFLCIAGGPALLPNGQPIPLPFLALIELVPGLAPISHAFRFTAPLLLCLGIAAAFAVRARPALLWLLPLWVLETSTARTLPTAVAPAQVPQIYDALQDDGLIVMDLPMSRQVLARSDLALFQLSHGHPIVYGLNDPTPAALRDQALVRHVLALERSPVASVAPGVSAWSLVAGCRALGEQDVGYIVLHLQHTPAHLEKPMTRLLDAACGDHEEKGQARLWMTQSTSL